MICCWEWHFERENQFRNRSCHGITPSGIKYIMRTTSVALTINNVNTVTIIYAVVSLSHLFDHYLACTFFRRSKWFSNFKFHKWILWSADYIGKCAVWPFSLLIIIYFSPFSFRKPPINLDQNNDTYTSKLNSTANEVIKRSNNNDDLKRATHKIKDFQWIAAALFASHKNHCSEETEEHQTDSQRKYWKKRIRSSSKWKQQPSKKIIQNQ